MAWLGLISYGIFLWHFPVLLTLRTHGTTGFFALLAAGLAITIPVSAASYYLLERPVMKLKYRRLLGR
jgi:peptidoglycan/LPS O-acetylase OafA/YrhL